MNTTPFTTACCGAFFEFSRLARQRIARHAHGSCLLPEPSGGRPCLVQWHIQFLGHHTYYLLTYLLALPLVPCTPWRQWRRRSKPFTRFGCKNCPIVQFPNSVFFLFFSFRALESGEPRTNNSSIATAQQRFTARRATQKGKKPMRLRSTWEH